MRETWEFEKFADLLKYPLRNGIYKKKIFHGSGSKIINMGELFSNPRIYSIPMKRLNLTSQEKTQFGVEPGDLLFARRSLTAEGAGKCSIVREVSEPTVFESSIIRARPDPQKAVPVFLYYLFNSPLGKSLLGSILRQVAVSGITGSDLADLKIPTPPLPEQRAIAHILGTLDDKIELNRRMNETLEAMAQALFKSWFVDFDPVRAKVERRNTGLPKEIEDLFPDSFEDSELGEIPRGWGVGTVGECFRLTMGQSPPGKTYNDTAEGLPFFQGSTDFGFRYPENRKFCSAPTRVANSDDTLLSVRAPVGDINMAWEKCCIGRGVASIRPKFGNFSYTYYTVWNLQEKLQQYEHTGTVFGAINKKQLETMKIIEPSETLIVRFESIVQPMDFRFRSNTYESRTLATLRDTLLPKLLSGEIRVSNVGRFLE